MEKDIEGVVRHFFILSTNLLARGGRTAMDPGISYLRSYAQEVFGTNGETDMALDIAQETLYDYLTAYRPFSITGREVERLIEKTILKVNDSRRESS